MILKVLLFASLLVHSTNFVLAQNPKDKIYTKYINCDLNYFLDNEFEDGLFNGLKAIIYSKYDKAEKQLLSEIPKVSDSLKTAIYNDLVYINYAKKNWTKGNEYVGTASGLAIQTGAHSARIEKLKIGEIDLFNVPVCPFGSQTNNIL